MSGLYGIINDKTRNSFRKSKFEETNVDSNGVKRTVKLDGDRLTINKEQDISGILKDNLRSQNHVNQTGNDIKKVASIPMIVVEKWASDGFDIIKKTMHGEKMDKATFEMQLRRRLNDPDYCYLRTDVSIL